MKDASVNTLRRRAASTGNATELAELVNHPDVLVRASCARNTGLTLPMQRALAAQKETQVALAENPMLDDELQLELVRTNTWVRRALSANASLTVEAARVLLEFDEDEVVATLAANPDLPWGPVLPVRLLKNTSVGRRLCARLVRDADPSTRSVLEPEWEGSLEELTAALGTLGPVGAS